LRERDREGLRESERYWEFSRTGVSCLIFCKPLSYVSSIFIYLLCFKKEDAKEVEAAIVLHLFGIFCKYFRLLEKKKDAKEVEAARAAARAKAAAARAKVAAARAKAEAAAVLSQEDMAVTRAAGVARAAAVPGK
jgi:hypothetical protein